MYAWHACLSSSAPEDTGAPTIAGVADLVAAKAPVPSRIYTSVATNADMVDLRVSIRRNVAGNGGSIALVRQVHRDCSRPPPRHVVNANKGLAAADRWVALVVAKLFVEDKENIPRVYAAPDDQ